MPDRNNAFSVPRALLCLIYLVALGWASLQPQASMPQEVSDKLLHLAAYAGAALLWGWAARTRKSLVLALPLLIAYGIGLEITQGLTPDRTPSATDALANSLGVIIGTCCILLLQRSTTLRQMLHLHGLT